MRQQGQCSKVVWPSLSGTASTSFGPILGTSGVWVPLTFWVTAAPQPIIVSVQHTAGAPKNVSWVEFGITRTGDAD